MKRRSKIILAIAAVLLIIQLPVFTPARNTTEAEPVNDIAKAYDVPMDILMDIYNSCYDCHSNYTKEYPWYYHIQPVSWWMALHIRNAKKELNFSEFATYPPEKAAKKFDEIREQLEKRNMPLRSYLLMHNEAKLSDEDYKNIIGWAKKMHDEITAKIDSVNRK